MDWRIEKTRLDDGNRKTQISQDARRKGSSKEASSEIGIPSHYWSDQRKRAGKN